MTGDKVFFDWCSTPAAAQLVRTKAMCAYNAQRHSCTTAWEAQAWDGMLSASNVHHLAAVLRYWQYCTVNYSSS
jgi:hypothetical protein